MPSARPARGVVRRRTGLSRKPSAPRPRPVEPAVRARLSNAGLVLVSLLLAYLALDFGLFHRFVDKVPLALNPQLGRIKVLGQSSKAGPEPHDYIAVFGDSYAAGAGDWVIGAGAHGNPDF